MYTHRKSVPCSRQIRGFSLIEVMVAVVILATGLLALAALQGALARNSGDAKARSAILAAMTSRMSEIRQGDLGCTPAPSAAPVGCDVTWSAGTDWLDDAAAQAGASNLTVQESIEIHYWDAVDKAFKNVFVDDVSSVTRAVLEANWIGADGSKTLVLSSDLSGRIYGDGTGYPNPDEDSSASVKPVVRQDSPENEDGVIPIAYGSGEDAQSTAASNPKPILIGSTTIVGTQFDVLTYVPEDGATAVIKRRIDTNLVKCRCTTGLAAKDRYSVSGVAQWPTIWDGDKYATYLPEDKAATPAEALKAGEDPEFAGKKRAQSDLCTECCRDRIDTADMPVKFGPEGEMQRYDLDGSDLVASSAGKFVAACRVIGNAGLYKTASDMYLRQFGLLQTTALPDSSSPKHFAKSGVPTKQASTNYGIFVKAYLGGYLPTLPSDGSAPTDAAGAQTAFDNFTPSLNVPAKVEIPQAGASDERFLHARGLYVDHLEQGALTRIGKVLAGCATLDCLLPHLAFTTINLTELARWSTSDGVKDGTDGTKLNVTASGTLLGTNVAEPMGGRTYGKANTSSSYTNAAASLSNSTIAFRANIPFTTPTEADSANWIRDAQQFVVGTTGGGDPPPLQYIQVFASGLLTELNTVSFTMVQASKDSACNPGSASYTCDVAVGNTLPGTVGLKISNFNKEESASSQSNPPVNVTCGATPDGQQKQPYRLTYSNIVVSLTEGGAPIGAFNPVPSDFRTATSVNWGSQTMDDKGSLYVSFLGALKVCPQIKCTGQNDETFSGWETNKAYDAAYCK